MVGVIFHPHLNLEILILFTSENKRQLPKTKTQINHNCQIPNWKKNDYRLYVFPFFEI